MPEPATAPPPLAQVPPAELPASVREAGLANWIREPLDDAVDRRRRIIVPPAVATMGTALSGCQGALMAQARGPDALVMMGDNPALPQMPDRPTLMDFFALRLSKTGTHHMLQSATLALDDGLDEKVVMARLLHDISIGGLIRPITATGARRWSPPTSRRRSPGPSSTTRRCATSPTRVSAIAIRRRTIASSAWTTSARIHPPGGE